MQTFLPLMDYRRSAELLDRVRLNRQRTECIQILKTLLTGSGAWYNHPATQMWAGYEGSLVEYTQAILNEWRNRRYRDNTQHDLWAICHTYPDLDKDRVSPWWLGTPMFHESHAASLFRKDPKYYIKLLAVRYRSIPYLWPDNTTRSFFIIRTKPGTKTVRERLYLTDPDHVVEYCYEDAAPKTLQVS